MRFETNAPGVGYARLTKVRVAKIKRDLRDQGEQYWPEAEDEPEDYSINGSSSWCPAIDRGGEIRFYTNKDEEGYVSGSDLKVIEFRMSTDGTVVVEATRLTSDVVDSGLALARSVAARLQDMNTEISTGMEQGGGFICFRTFSNDLHLAIDLRGVEVLRPEQDITLLVLSSSLGQCVQEYFLGLLVGGRAYAWTESEWGGGGDAYLNSYFDEQGRKFMDFLIYPKDAKVTSYLAEDQA